jgi:hypothetical protein
MQNTRIKKILSQAVRLTAISVSWICDHELWLSHIQLISLRSRSTELRGLQVQNHCLLQSGKIQPNYLTSACD